MLSIGPGFFPVVSAANALGFFHPMFVGASQVSISSSLFFFCLRLFRVFFSVGCLPQCILLHKCLEPSFSFAQAGVVVECFCYNRAYTLYHVYLFIIKKNSVGRPMHIYYSP